MFGMGRKKDRAEQVQKTETPPAPEVAKDRVGGNLWWVKCTNREFKEEIAGMTYEQCKELLEAIREACRWTTLRVHVESLSEVEQKLAARLAPIHAGRREAVLVRIHGMIRPNETAEKA